MTQENPRPQQPSRRSLPLILGVIGIIAIVAVVVLLLIGTPPPIDEEPPAPEPVALLSEVIDNLQAVETFRLLIEQTGAVYPFFVSLDEGQSVVQASMRRGEAQFRQPNILYATVNLRVGMLPVIGVDLYAEGLNQWFRLAGSWINFPIAEGFDPGELMSDDGGFSHALNQLNEVEYIGAETLIDGTRTWHVRGTASGQVVNELLFGLLEVPQEIVTVDVYIEQQTKLPAVLAVTIPDTATEEEPEDSVWRIEVYDVNGEITYEAPPAVRDDVISESTGESTGEAPAEATPDATAEATPDATSEASNDG